MPRVLIVTGEASGDLHGASLAKALRRLRPDIELVGMGGSHMRAAGLEMLHGIEGHDVVGMIGPAQLRKVLRTYFALARFLRNTELDAVVFIDYPGFNLRMARIAARAGHRVIYYIAPQIWAWRPGRIRLISRVVDRVLVIFPFEEALYRAAGVSCDFVGHPLLDTVAPAYEKAELRQRFGLDRPGPIVGLLPGSRESEVRALLPIMLGAAERLMRDHPDIHFVLAQPSSVSDSLLEACLDGRRIPVRVVKDQANEAIAACDLLLVASGTATLQAAVIGTPMVITYRVSWLTYWIARLVIRIGWIGLVNIVAGRSIVPEVLQHEATPERLSAEVQRLLTNPEAYQAMVAELRAVRASLGAPGASRRAATHVLAECGG
jgi:lipid-A-disaccharide synthase